MRLFRCPHCSGCVAFEDVGCGGCGSLLGFVPGDRDMAVLDRAEGARFTLRSRPEDRVWRCLNLAWGCNWLVADDGTGPWCESCRLTRGRPSNDSVEGITGWREAESAKRWLLFQLAELGLPVQARSAATPGGLVFDMVFVPGAPAVTGHRDGVVTVDLTEADEAHRARLRTLFAEPYRTLLGHLRHEIGHYYWPILVGQERRHSFRGRFGDERRDYAAALQRHHADRGSEWQQEYISAYAAAHPWEDWAETFAHYLHIRDTLQTATCFGLNVPRAPDAGSPGPVGPDAPRPSFEAILAAWIPLMPAINAVNRSMGFGGVYPFTLNATVIGKLSFVHDAVNSAPVGADQRDSALTGVDQDLDSIQVRR